MSVRSSLNMVSSLLYPSINQGTELSYLANAVYIYINEGE